MEDANRTVTEDTPAPARGMPPLEQPVVVEAAPAPAAAERPEPPVSNPPVSNPPVSNPPVSNPPAPAAPVQTAAQREGRTRVIALMNQKGGVGKTTTTVSVGAAMALAGQRVLLIDLDPQAHLTLSLGIQPEELDRTNYDLLCDENCTALEVVQTVAGYQKLAVLPAETNLAGVESELAEMLRTGLAQSILRTKCKDLFSHFDVVMIDCPPSLGLLTINALTAASEIIVPMQAHFLALQGMTKLFETVQQINAGINPNLIVSGVVLCMHEGGTLLANDVVRELESFFGEHRGFDTPWADAIIYQPPVRRNIKLAEAPSFGRSVHTYAPDSNGAQDYAKLARSILTHDPAAV